MKRIILLAIIIMIQWMNGFGQTSVMTMNIRLDYAGDEENRWDNRKEEVVKMLDYYHPEIIGAQEALIHQLAFINDNLNSYTYIGVGRDDGKEKGEFSAILFDTVKFKLLETKTFWLSETPDTVSVGWDASMERICTYGAFMNKNTKDSLFVFNCHFDHIGKSAREMSSKLILKKMHEFGVQAKRVIVMGDLNCEPRDKPMQILLGELDDALEISKVPSYGPEGTFNGFSTDIQVKKRIDYILTYNLKVNSYRHVDDRRKNNLYLSDHLPVLVELTDVDE